MSQSPQEPSDPDPTEPPVPPAALPAQPWGPPPPVAPGAWQQWAVPAPVLRFDPADPLISDTYGGWWRRSLALVRASWTRLALVQLVAFVVSVAVLIPTEISYERQQREVAGRLDGTDQLPDVWAAVQPQVTAGLVSIIPALINMLAILMSILVLVTVVTGGPPTIGATLRAGLSRMLPLLGWNVVAGLISVAALLACILPVFYVTAVFTILTVVVALERTNAIKRCFQLFHTDLGAALARIATLAGVAVVGSIVIGIVTLVVTIAIQGADAALDPTVAVSAGKTAAIGVVNALIGGVTYFLAGVVGTPFLLTTYADLRARHEPFATPQLAPAADQAPSGSLP